MKKKKMRGRREGENFRVEFSRIFGLSICCKLFDISCIFFRSNFVTSTLQYSIAMDIKTMEILRYL